MSSMPGLSWKKLDLHVHTPASKCFAGTESAATADAGKVTAEAVVQTAIQKGLAGIAVCDHMTGVYIDEVRRAAKGTTLTVFPGVELSMEGGWHIVAILDRKHGRTEVDLLLGALGITGEKYGSTQHPIRTGSAEVLKAIRDAGGLAVLAHIDCEGTGAWVKTQGATRRELFNDPNYAAVEVISAPPPKQLVDPTKGKSEGYMRQPAYYYASDNPCPDNPKKHCIAGIGKRFTYFKVVDDFTLESLRQCFEDPNQRIVLPEHFGERMIPRIRRLTVSGGFFGDAVFDFHRGLNSIIGGKGVGKSLVVEFLRLGLGDPPDTPSIRQDHNGKVASQLADGGGVEIECVTKTGDRLVARCGVTEAVPRSGSRSASYDSVVEVRNADTNEEMSVDMRRAFPVKVFSQGEIVEITREKGEQLMQIDSFLDLTLVNQAVEDLLVELDGELDKLVASKAAAAQLAELKKEHGTARQQLRELESLLANVAFEEHQKHEVANTLMEGSLRGWDELHQIVEDVLGEIARWVAPAIAEDDLVGDLVATMLKRQTEMKSSLKRALDDLLLGIDKAKLASGPDVEAWQKKFDEVKQKYEAFKKKAGGDYELLDKRRQSAQRKVAKAKAKWEEAKQVAQVWNTAASMALGICDRLDTALVKRHAIRQAKAEELSALSGGMLRMRVDRGAGRKPTLGVLKDAASGLQEPTLLSFAEVLPSYRLALLLLSVAKTTQPPEWTTQEQWLKLAGKVLSRDYLKNYLSRLARSVPEDVPLIEFQRHGGNFAALEELSQGQKCTALLLLTLAQGEEPVIIDQPEDSLDVRAVWDDVVLSIRRRKGERQFIFTTHNSSIAVAGDSDCITIIEPKGKVAAISCVGAIDQPEIKDGVITHLEGGRFPYGLRRRKYNVSDR